MIINHNLGANNANRTMGINQNNSSKSMEKLASGMRINRAADDAAGLAISEKMRGQIRGLDQASNNAQDGISLIQTAEGATSEIHSILQRMRELAVQSGSDTITASDRVEVQKETDQLAQEIGRVGNTTQFNTQKLIDGSYSASFQIGSNQDQSMAIKMGDMRSNALGVTGDVTVNFSDKTNNDALLGLVTPAQTTASPKADIAVGTYTVSASKTEVVDPALADANVNLKYDKFDLVDVTGSIVASSTDGFTFKNTNEISNTIVFSNKVTSGKVNVIDDPSTAPGVATKAIADVVGNINAVDTGTKFTTTLEAGTYKWDKETYELKDDGGNIVATSGDGITFTRGSYADGELGPDGATAAAMEPKVVLKLNDGAALANGDLTVKVHGVDVSSKALANTAITTIQKAIEKVSAQRSTLGSYQNRLEHTITNLGTTSENLTSAESRIRDVDMAKEMSQFSKNNILSQAAQAMLAQANQQPQQVLQLLR